MQNSKLYTFYSFNEKMEDDELSSQIIGFKSQGFTGFFVHARAGLMIEYLGKEWLHKFELCIKKAKELNLEVGIYDENGWPSGFAGGKVNNRGYKYQQKKIVFCKACDLALKDKKIIAAYKKIDKIYKKCDIDSGELFACVEINASYVDLLSEEVTMAFLEETHEVYRQYFGDEFGKTIKYIFSDEPQLAAPYSYTLGIENLFFKEYGYDLTENLWQLNFTTESFNKFHYDYQKLCYKIFKENFTDKISEWCKKNHLEYTGHFACEESFVTLNLNGGVQNQYISMQMPGIDYLGRRIAPISSIKQLTSIKNIFEKPYILSETFGCCGWNTTFREFSYIWGYQASMGVNLPCLHLSCYSIKGLRKRDYPAFFNYQESWWNDFNYLANWQKNVNNFVSHYQKNNILVISPENSILGLSPECQLAKDLSNSYLNTIEILNSLQLQYDVINENILNRFAYVESDNLKINNNFYKVILISKTEAITEKTYKLLVKARENKINVVFVDSFISVKVLDTDIDLKTNSFKTTYSRYLELNDYFLSIFYDREVSVVSKYDRKLETDIIINTFSNNYIIFNISTTSKKQSILKLQNCKKIYKYNANRNNYQEFLSENGLFNIEINPLELLMFTTKVEKSIVNLENNIVVGINKFKNKIELNYYDTQIINDNSLTIDRATFKLDNGVFSKEMPVILIEDELVKYQAKEVVIKYIFNVVDFKNTLKLAIESDNAKKVLVNGKQINLNNILSYYIDKSIKVFDITNFYLQGENSVEVVYNIKDSKSLDLGEKSETLRNIFFYSLEVENIYILGDFNLHMEGKTHREVNYIGVENAKVSIKKVKEILFNQSIVCQGYWYYRGQIKCKIDIPNIDKDKVLLKIYNNGFSNCKLNFESGAIEYSFDENDLLDISNYKGKTIEIIFNVSNRNALGAHHHILGEPNFVGERVFRGVRGFEDELSDTKYYTKTYTENYNFVDYGFLKFEIIY